MQNFFENESGATAVEYGLIAALIAVVIIGSVTALGENTSSTFNKIAGEIDTTGGGGGGPTP
ncbi:MAG: Flp family type IVb pilin [Pseudomonadota bacterium]